MRNIPSRWKVITYSWNKESYLTSQSLSLLKCKSHQMQAPQLQAPRPPWAPRPLPACPTCPAWPPALQIRSRGPPLPAPGPPSTPDTVIIPKLRPRASVALGANRTVHPPLCTPDPITLSLSKTLCSRQLTPTCPALASARPRLRPCCPPPTPGQTLEVPGHPRSSQVSPTPGPCASRDLRPAAGGTVRTCYVLLRGAGPRTAGGAHGPAQPRTVPATGDPGDTPRTGPPLLPAASGAPGPLRPGPLSGTRRGGRGVGRRPLGAPSRLHRPAPPVPLPSQAEQCHPFQQAGRLGTRGSPAHK